MIDFVEGNVLDYLNKYYRRGKWILDSLNKSKNIGPVSRDKKVFVSNVGGWDTSEYPINRIEIIEVKKLQVVSLLHKIPKSNLNDKIKVIALIETNPEDYLIKPCISLGDVMDCITKENETYPIGSMTEFELINGGWFSDFLTMQDASPNSYHDCDNIDARKVYGEDIFRFGY